MPGCIRCLLGSVRDSQRIFKLARLIRRLDIDLVHTSNVDGELHGGIAGRMTGVPVVGTLTNIAGEQVRLVDNPYLNGRKLRWARRLRRLLRRTHAATSRYPTTSRSRPYGGGTAAGCRRSHLPGHAGWWARSGSRSCEAVRRELDTERRYPVLLTVGRLVPQKGQRYLIEAMPDVLRAHAQLLIVGMGFLEQKLRAQVDALGLRRRSGSSGAARTSLP